MQSFSPEGAEYRDKLVVGFEGFLLYLQFLLHEEINQRISRFLLQPDRFLLCDAFECLRENVPDRDFPLLCPGVLHVGKYLADILPERVEAEWRNISVPLLLQESTGTFSVPEELQFFRVDFSEEYRVENIDCDCSGFPGLDGFQKFLHCSFQEITTRRSAPCPRMLDSAQYTHVPPGHPNYRALSPDSTVGQTPGDRTAAPDSTVRLC